MFLILQLLVQFIMCLFGMFTSMVSITIYVVIVMWCMMSTVPNWCMPNTTQNITVSFICIAFSALMLLSSVMSVVLWMMLMRNIKQQDAEEEAQKKKILEEALNAPSPYN